MSTTDMDAPEGAATPGREQAGAPPTGAAKRLERRRGLPGGRAVVGGFLVAAAAVGVFAAYLDATSGPEHSWVVATADVTAGEQLEPGDLGLVDLDLPPELRQRAFTDPDDVVGAVVTAPVAQYDLVLATHVADDTAAGTEQLSFAIDESRAVAGALRPGDRINVLASFRREGETEAVARDLLVLSVLAGDGGIGGGDLVLTVALEREADALALTRAITEGELQVVRVTTRDATAARR